jgi:ribosomal protein S20
MIKLSEIIKVPIEIGDTVLGGKFKNKRIVVKSIGKNDKGDITINNKPMMKVRILPKPKDTSGKTYVEATIKERTEELYKMYSQAMKMMPDSPKQKELIKKITALRKKLKMNEALGPSDEARRYMMLQLYGSNFVTNYKRLLNGIKNEKTGVIKKSWKDFQAIYNQIEKEIKQII